MYKKIIFLISILFLNSFVVESFQEEDIWIPNDHSMKKIIFDGKWTDGVEWKSSSLDRMTERIWIRTAHSEEYVYVLIDAAWDTSIEKRTDKAIICFDTMNDKSIIPQEDDYCFQSTLGSPNAITLQGGSPIMRNGHFKNISNHENLIAVGNVSDENDRYDKTPHAVYEFRIPTDVIGRSDNYGFFVYVFDANRNSVETWPDNIELNKIMNIPSPSQWGNLISPDKSLPEFDEKIILFSLALLPVFMLSKFKKKLFNISLNK